ncbi:hypothetical protein GCM10007301_16930 [Azorhizobium oxalatiphilum]|uniref:Methyltransferase type 11 domain-containing protein n=1 Tax=Azorhizobium oxalatiphilum TaxID=980631 RepID=A0A917F8H6_9HYPH|nr:methyltransferase domain-containing protein [Azorhizobium oxalatiphilum]GGF57835.1 hypothetical protein GCM10007301_16930 [Azorhizobium oxalatiphilum]
MRRRHFETLKPVCPACRQAGQDHALALEHGFLASGEDISAGILRCSDPGCWKAYPIIAGTPILVPDVATWLAANLHLVLQRGVETGPLEELVGTAVGPDAAFNLVRQQQSTYGHDHYGDLFADEAEGADGTTGSVRTALDTALERLPPRAGATLDMGCAAGRTSFDLAAATGRLVLGIDLNWQLMSLGRGLIDEGRITYPLRRSGNTFERRSCAVKLPGAELVDFWIADALALPFADGSFGHATAFNVLDCVAEPARLVRETHRVLETGAGFALSTPFDWASHATSPAHWIEGPEALSRLLSQVFIEPGTAEPGHAALQHGELPWTVRLHDNASVQYRATFYVVSKL